MMDAFIFTLLLIAAVCAFFRYGFREQCTSAEMKAAARVSEILELPDADADEDLIRDGTFDPWDIFPVYGCYSSAFDECAIQVLEDIRDGTFSRTDLAAEMFREMLCVMDLCDYGTSPRGCFATREFKPLLPMLIQRWKSYYAMQWGGEYAATHDTQEPRNV